MEREADIHSPSDHNAMRMCPATTLRGHNSFKHSFTLFAEFFAPFDHSTSALSVAMAILRRDRYPAARGSCCTIKQHYSEGTTRLSSDAQVGTRLPAAPSRGWSPCIGCTIPGGEGCGSRDRDVHLRVARKPTFYDTSSRRPQFPGVRWFRGGQAFCRVGRTDQSNHGCVRFLC